MKNLVIGILAHVDAGKTTLSENMLYYGGSIRQMGRVDNKNAFLDTYELEKKRGITIFSKQAIINLDNARITLIDTPGHTDFSSEMERSLQILDYAILVINGAEGIQSHTYTLWRLLRNHNIPTFIFVNKMDQERISKTEMLKVIQKKLDEGIIDFACDDKKQFYDELAMCDEKLMEEYIEFGIIKDYTIAKYVSEGKIFPCYFGSALKSVGIEELMNGISTYTAEPVYPDEFGARVYKIARDEQGNRLTFLKVTGGILRVKSFLKDQEKINQIRLYSGSKYELTSEALAGTVCAVTGPVTTYASEGFGYELDTFQTLMNPVLTYRVILPENIDAAVMLPQIKNLEEEEPKLHVLWNEELKEIQLRIMGGVQLEIIHSLIMERTGVDVSFDTGNIVYKETITDIVEGVGHFEPLKHYAEVHLIMEPGEPGSGIVVESQCSEDMLNRNWQRLIMTHLEEKEHKGVLTGSAITDIKIILAAGRAHEKHTEGGDFRQATYRAVRQGLMNAKSRLLEPYYEFTLVIPQSVVGRAMMDIERMSGKCSISDNNDDMTVITGTAPVSEMREYQKDVISYSKGLGKLNYVFCGYGTCHNETEIIKKMAYNPDADLDNPSSSVFCSHGAGYQVEWNRVPDYMHLESVFKNKITYENKNDKKIKRERIQELTIGEEEINSILNRTYRANSQDKISTRKWKYEKVADKSEGMAQTRTIKLQKEYLLIDGYNVIFAWDELKELAKVNLDSARGRLLDILCNYQAVRKIELIAVFDAYKIKGHETEYSDYHNIHVVYTKEAETADRFIERFAHENGKKNDVTVVTSDGLEQIIIRGQGCKLISSREFKKEVENLHERNMEIYIENKTKDTVRLDVLMKDYYQQKE